MNLDHEFKVLGLQPNASWDDVKSAFRRLARAYHPDVAGAEGQRKFAEITEAYMKIRDAISPGAGRSTSRHGSPGGDETIVPVKKGRSFFKSLWNKITSLFKRPERERARTVETETEYEIPQMRIRSIINAISRAEDDIHSIMSRRGEIKNKAETEALLSRVTSRHPAVALLALKRINIRDTSDELRAGILEHFKRSMPESEVLEELLATFSGTQYADALASALTTHVKTFSESDANVLLKWYKRNQAPRDCFVSLLAHPSPKVAGTVLSSWPTGVGIASLPIALSLLQSDDETVLVPLLRLLKREKIPPQMRAVILSIADTTDAQNVKVWASAIVRDQNLGSPMSIV